MTGMLVKKWGVGKQTDEGTESAVELWDFYGKLGESSQQNHLLKNCFIIKMLQAAICKTMWFMFYTSYFETKL